jgi:NTE family protein
MGSKKRVGLALGGGAVRGFAHLGVIEVLARESIPIDFVAGTSVGSMIGAAFCTGMSLDEIYALSKQINWRRIVRPHWGTDGIVSFRGIRDLIDEVFDTPTFEDLKIPFAVVTTDIDADTGMVLSQGKFRFGCSGFMEWETSGRWDICECCASLSCPGNGG